MKEERKGMSRRTFLKTGTVLGGGLLLGFHLPASAVARKSSISDPNAWIRVGKDESVTIYCNHSEMGQGVYTSLPMLIAEELEVDWKNVRVEGAPVAPVYNHPTFGIQMTGGSTSVASSWIQLRQVGAAAREMLVTAAAGKWRVKKEECRAELGHVLHERSGRKVSYGSIAAAAAKVPVPEKVVLKDPVQHHLVGTSARRTDSPAKLEGKAIYGIDVMRPGMLTALIARPPVFGGQPAKVKDGKATKVLGVRTIVTVPSGVAVIADGFPAAKKGRELLEIEWDDRKNGDISTASLLEEYERLSRQPGKPARREGNAERALEGARQTMEAEYHVPYLAHAPMEPLNCVVDLKPGSCEIWTGTQFQTVDRDNAARVAGLKKSQVKLHTTYLGGGFGRRANPQSDFVVEAVQVAKAAKAPVKVMWTREDDTRGGWYRPLWYDRIEAALDAGKVVAWRHRIVGQSIMAGTSFEAGVVKNGIDDSSVEGAADIPYAIPNLSVELHSPRVGVPVQWWRSVGHSHTAFVVESFIDELAATAGKDPVAFRLEMLGGHPRHCAVLQAVAEKGDWGKPLPKGKGRGVAVHQSFRTYVAYVVEVTVGVDGGVKVDRITAAVDCGRVVNPDGVKAQIEGGAVFGLSAALYGEITLSRGRVKESNFHNYPILRMNEMPKIEVHIMPSREDPTGVGEPGVPPIAPAVANAVYAASGVRVRSLPLGSPAVKKALRGEPGNG